MADKQQLSKLFTLVGLGLGYLPAGALITDWLTPFWQWIETQTGIVAMGEEFPAAWCFIVIYALLAVILFVIFGRKK